MAGLRAAVTHICVISSESAGVFYRHTLRLGEGHVSGNGSSMENTVSVQVCA